MKTKRTRSKKEQAGKTRKKSRLLETLEQSTKEIIKTRKAKRCGHKETEKLLKKAEELLATGYQLVGACFMGVCDDPETAETQKQDCGDFLDRVHSLLLKIDKRWQKPRGK